MCRVRVGRKGQVTVPTNIREKMKIDEGTLLEVREHPEGILLTPVSGIKAGKAVGRHAYEKIIRELDELRGV